MSNFPARLIGHVIEYNLDRGIGAIGQVPDFDGIQFGFNFKHYEGFPEVGRRVSFEGSRFGSTKYIAEYIRPEDACNNP